MGRMIFHPLEINLEYHGLIPKKQPRPSRLTLTSRLQVEEQSVMGSMFYKFGLLVVFHLWPSSSPSALEKETKLARIEN